VDWYRFTLKASTTMRIVLGNLPVDASLSLYNGCSTLATTSDRSGTGTEEIFRILPKGTYAVRVSAKGASSTDPYSLLIKSMPTGLRVVTGSSRVAGSSLVIVGELYNGTSSTLGVVTVTAKLYDAGGHLLATRTVRPESYVAKATRVPFRLVGSVPAGFAKTVLSVTGSSTSKKIAALSFSGVTAGYDASRYRMRGSITASVAVSSIRTSMTSYDTFGTVVDVTRAVIGTSTLGAHKSTTFDAWSSLASPIDRATVRSVGFVK
jgi:hypothetical protein